MRRAIAVLFLGAVAASTIPACKDDAPSGAKLAEGKAETGKVAATAVATGAPSAVAAAKLPAGRTPMPTLDEWNTQRKEVTVKGSSALGCETKIVREYLRVACKGKNDSGGTPKTVQVTKGGRGEVLTFAAPGVATLIVPFVEGIFLEAVFSWTDKSYKLGVIWPKGSKQPVVVGVFEGAASPLDSAAKGDGPKLCECYKKLTKLSTCDDLMGAADADCDRTYGSDCQPLLECARGEPGRPPRCLPGFSNFGAAMRCAKECTSDADCAAAPGTSCNADMGVSVCI